MGKFQLPEEMPRVVTTRDITFNENSDGFFFELSEKSGTQITCTLEQWMQMAELLLLTGQWAEWKPLGVHYGPAKCKSCGAEKCTKNHAEFF